MHWAAQWQLHLESERALIGTPSETTALALRISASSPGLAHKRLSKAKDLVQEKLRGSRGLVSMAASSAPSISVSGPQPSPAKDSGPRIGQIIALPRQMALCQFAEMLVLVISGPHHPDASHAGESWQVIPFAPLSMVATDQEWQTPWAERHSNLAVLCIWNSFSITGGALEAGLPWFEASEEECAAVRDLWLTYRIATALPEEVSEAVGPELGEPDDPRQDYLRYCERQTELWRGMVACPRAFQVSSRAVLPFTASVAISPTRWQVEHFSIPAHDLRLRLSLSDQEVELCIVNDAGQISNSLNGIMLVTPGGSAAGFSAGSIRVIVERLRSGFALVDQDYNVVILEEEA